MTTCIRRPHATWTSCRCETCTPERLHLAKLARTGRRPIRRSEAAWAEVDALLAAGWSSGAIASAAHLSADTMRNALALRSRWTTHHARAILTRDPWPTEGLVPIIGATRRVRALAALGWDLGSITRETGVPTMTLSWVRAGKGEHVSAGTHAAIRAAYDLLEMRAGPSAITRATAARSCWAGPLAWDDIDDPAATPDVGGTDDTPDDVAVQLVLDGIPHRLTQAERAIAVPVLIRRGLSQRQIAELCMTTKRTIARDREVAA